MAESYPAPYHPPWSAGYPSRPLCSDDLAAHGLWRAPLCEALKQPYIQPNPARRVWVIVLDVDRPGAAVDWQSSSKVPPPNWTTTSRASGHAHLAYVLAAPVAISDAARIAPLRLLARVQRALVAVTEADRGYSGLITKTPHHPRWLTVIWHQQPYDLAELCDYLPDSALALADQASSRVEQQGLGRNVTLFDRLRRWAYRSRGSFADADAWRNACLAKAVELAHELGGEVLPLSEVRAIARSVAKWTWRRLDVRASAERFSALQRERGKPGRQAAGVAHASARFDRMAALAALLGGF